MAFKNFFTRFKLKKDTTSKWNTNNPVLLDGEPGVEVNGSKVKAKIGDGSTPWGSLPYLVGDDAELVEVMNVGHKNMCEIRNYSGAVSEILGSVQVIANAQESWIPAGTYVVSFKSFSTTASTKPTVIFHDPLFVSTGSASFTPGENGAVVVTTTRLSSGVRILAGNTFSDSVGKQVAFDDLMICKKELYDIDPSYQPYSKSNEMLTKQGDENSAKLAKDEPALREVMNTGCKNLFKSTLESVWSHTSGVTVTPLGDGTFRVAGYNASSDSAWCKIGNVDEAHIGAVLSGESVFTSLSIGGSDRHDGYVISSEYLGAAIYIRILPGATPNDTVKPMICKKELYNLDPSYQPYAKSNPELTKSLDSYLPLTGGTIDGPLIINATTTNDDRKLEMSSSGNALFRIPSDRNRGFAGGLYFFTNNKSEQLAGFGWYIGANQSPENGYYYLGEYLNPKGILKLSKVVGDLEGNADSSSILKGKYLSMSNKTILDIQAALDDIASKNSSSINIIGTVGMQMDNSWITRWNSNDTTTLTGGSRWTFTLIGSYSTNAYGAWLITSYINNNLFIVIKSNGAWGKIKKIALEENVPSLAQNASATASADVLAGIIQQRHDDISADDMEQKD